MSRIVNLLNPILFCLEYKSVQIRCNKFLGMGKILSLHLVISVLS